MEVNIPALSKRPQGFLLFYLMWLQEVLNCEWLGCSWTPGKERKDSAGECHAVKVLATLFSGSQANAANCRVRKNFSQDIKDSLLESLLLILMWMLMTLRFPFPSKTAAPSADWASPE